MGEAKKRGTFNERKNMAIKRDAENHKKRNQTRIKQKSNIPLDGRSARKFMSLSSILSGIMLLNK